MILASSLAEKLTLPVMQAPMFLISGPDMVVNACRAGIIGSFPTQNARTPEILDQWLSEISNRLAQQQISTPWAVNLITHPTYARGKDDFEMILKHKPPIVITALGSPAALVEEVHNYGGIVLADVINPSYAKKAAAAKVDGLVLVSTGAGGHTGYLSPFVFVQEIRKFWQGLIVLGGGIGSGKAVLAAQAMGADIAYLGTRFIPTHESLCQTEYKQMVVDSCSDDVVVSDAITGVKANWLRQSLINGGYNPDKMPSAANINFASAAGAENKRWKDIWAAGQGVASSTEIQTISEIVATLSEEYQSSLTNLLDKQKHSAQPLNTEELQ
ncbi:NAD(P)H-dependent flavin oxidoreductase [Paraglaciecola arctica]|uniref:NAD(P)H-dependent flavin oxidoreductase n=1 Tax=Paraglaciecola arctica TaxID=1128911 RepID=UPI001C06D2DF|nr:nitronate monooxygenase [Paraglaciecola arctica]MBU3004955.1 nitronate monooxygenase [Paraglaciecola arctica]